MMEKVIVIDLGSQYTLLLANAIRSSGVYSEVVQVSDFIRDYGDVQSGDQPGNSGLRGLVLSGGPDGSRFSESEMWSVVEKLGVPVLGICLGAQLMATRYGGRVIPADGCEYGSTQIYRSRNGEDDQIFDEFNIPEVWMSHSDSIVLDDSPIRTIAKTIEKSVVAAFIVDVSGIKMWGFQFHPEVTHTPSGRVLIRNFLRLCGCSFQWTAGCVLRSCVRSVISQVDGQSGLRVWDQLSDYWLEATELEVGETRLGKAVQAYQSVFQTEGSVMVACSGGVDSMVVAMLIQWVLGQNRMRGVFLDTGLLRKGEFDQVMSVFNRLNLNVTGLDVGDRFFEGLKGIVKPELKRKTIGHLFIEVFEEFAGSNVGGVGVGGVGVGGVGVGGVGISFLAQGTIYPDVIESLGGIKSHHNVGGLPEKMGLKLVEPVRKLFKDEVRVIGQELLREYGVKNPREIHSILGRHPFPGPGLGIRIMGEVTRDGVRILQEADQILREELVRNGLYDQIWQSGVILLGGIRTVGVQGDNRTYGQVVALRLVDSVNGMTASVSDIPLSWLCSVSTRIVNSIPEINRVVYDVTSKPPGTIEWE